MATSTKNTAPLRVGLLGLGTVGQGVLRVLAQNGDEIERRLGRRIVVSHIAMRDPSAKRDCDLSGVTICATAAEVVAADVDVIAELIGGMQPAQNLVLDAIARGKPVITANKALIAEHGNEIFAAAQAKNVFVGFEAAVAGGIPIIKAVREGLSANRIDSLAGIINGTSNYILTQMSRRGIAFAEALAEAQKLGYAEADPTFDVEGIDAAHKLNILASLAFGTPLRFSAVATEGISQVLPQDIQLAQELGYRIKSLGIAKHASANGEDTVELRVHPTLVPVDHLLAKTDGALNAIRVHGNAVGQTVFVGKGAGGDATASAVIADLIDAARWLAAPAQAVPYLGFGSSALKEARALAFAEIESAYYLRLKVADEPGVLRAITSILADLDISVEAILQKEPGENEDATLAIITSQIPESRCNRALEKLSELTFVRAGWSRLRVEHFED